LSEGTRSNLEEFSIGAPVLGREGNLNGCAARCLPDTPIESNDNHRDTVKKIAMIALIAVPEHRKS